MKCSGRLVISPNGVYSGRGISRWSCSRLPRTSNNEVQDRLHLARPVGAKLDERRPKVKKMKLIANIPLLTICCAQSLNNINATSNIDLFSESSFNFFMKCSGIVHCVLTESLWDDSSTLLSSQILSDWSLHNAWPLWSYSCRISDCSKRYRLYIMPVIWEYQIGWRRRY